MTGTVFVNGDWLEKDAATISVFDRGFLFADAVYEVVAVLDGRLVDFDAHLARLERSLNAIDLPLQRSRDEWLALFRGLVSRNAIDDGIAYVQVSRGPAVRDFAFPDNPTPTVVAFAAAKRISDSPLAESGIAVVTRPDIRWRRCDIKTVGLLGASMTKQAAIDSGADDAWFYDDLGITEGTSSNAYIVTADRELVTRQLGTDILAGITREVVLDVASREALTVVERVFSVDEAHAASEAFITSATTFVQPIVKIDDRTLGDGRPGPIVKKLRRSYIDRARELAL
ncbi:MAG: D-amino-acid transaminase [Pseudomonadota bacterium]